MMKKRTSPAPAVRSPKGIAIGHLNDAIEAIGHAETALENTDRQWQRTQLKVMRGFLQAILLGLYA